MCSILSYFPETCRSLMVRVIFLKVWCKCYKKEICLRNAEKFVFFLQTRQGWEVAITLVFPIIPAYIRGARSLSYIKENFS